MKYVQKPIVVEAIQFQDNAECLVQLSEFMDKEIVVDYSAPYDPKLKIMTLGVLMAATEGDYIIKGISGEFYPCKPDIFEKTYEKVILWDGQDGVDGDERIQAPEEGMNFGLAIEAMKRGKKVAREGWNGKGMWLRVVHPYLDKQFIVTEGKFCEGTLLPYIGMKTADNGFVPWLASQTDMLSDDWMIVE